MNILLTDVGCSAILTGSAAANLGGDPYEFFSFVNAGPDTTFGIIILHFTGPKPGLMKR
jgi:hypothetical protein